MSTALALEITSGTHGVRVRVRGDVDLSSERELQDALVQLGVFSSSIEVDLREVTFMDSTGLNMLVRLHQDAVGRGSAMTVVAPPEHVRRLFEITGLDAMLTVISEG